MLQDVHWSAGLVGYFPTYTLGTLYSAQFLDAIERELGPDRRASCARASTTACSAGCASTCTAAARSSPPEQIARDATGEALGHAAFMRYLRAKYGELYDLGG